MKNLPKTIFAKWNEDDSAGLFISADEEAESLIEVDEGTIIGTYELKSLSKVTKELVFKEVSKPKRKRK